MMETVSGTNMQMEMVSPTHKCMMEMVSGTNVQSYRPSHTANTYLSYLLIVLQKINSLERKRRRLIAMTMTISILKIKNDIL